MLLRPTSAKGEHAKKMGDIHPFAQLLNISDLDDCDWLEHTAFDASEAASREKVSLSANLSTVHISMIPNHP